MKQKQRIRTIGSISNELLKKSREAALAAVQVFNNPAITFKSEVFVVLMVISWTYLLHAHFRKQGIEYRYFKNAGERKRFEKTTKGAYKFWELERCLNEKGSPVDKIATNNLRFLIGLRHEIEHQMTNRLDEHLSARFQACCLNYNDLVKRLFGDEFGIDRHLSFSLQFSSINTDQVKALNGASGLPGHIRAFINAFDADLTEAEFNDPRFAYRVLFVPKTVNHKGQADQVIEFINADSELAKDVNKHYAVVKETEKEKYLPKQVVELMQKTGFPKFTIHAHTLLWKQSEARKPGKRLGVQVVNTWYWYQAWVDLVKAHCIERQADFA